MKALKKAAPQSKDKIDPKSIQKDYLSKIEDSLVTKGVVLFDMDNKLNINDEYLELPKDITDATSRSLGEYLNAYTQQKVYCRTLLGRSTLLLEEAQREYFQASHPYYKKYSETKLSETAKERMVISEPDVQKSYHAYVDAKKRFEILEIAIANIEDIIFMISREVTRRDSDFRGEYRNESVCRK